MRTFKREVRQINGGWGFKWWNVGYLPAEGLEGPFASREEAEQASEAFKAQELARRPNTTVFID